VFSSSLRPASLAHDACGQSLRLFGTPPLPLTLVRILVVSALYPPVAFGGYEVECSGVVERLGECGEVLVLTSDLDRDSVAAQMGVRRELARLTHDARGARRAPAAALRAARAARNALAWEPDLVYVWNGASIPQAALRVLADSQVPLAFRVCEHWFGGLFTGDQFMRELLPARRGPARAAWAAGCRTLNALPALRLDPRAPLRTAISWNSEAIKRMVRVQPFVEPVLERVGHSVPRYGDVYDAVVRAPAPDPEIMFLGRVTPYKGLFVAIEALALLRSEHGLPARMVVIGPEDPEHGAELRDLAASLGVADAIDWRGPLAPELVAAQLARAHALIVSSVWDEPFPLVTIEGALARVPLVASDVGGIGEGMHNEEHALLFPRADAPLAAAALARTLQEREQTDARVERAYGRAQSFRLGPYLDAQERFVLDAHSALTGTRPDRPGRPLLSPTP
jgi:glycosyltransferase involved in cell wall biosynthesis